MRSLLLAAALLAAAGAVRAESIDVKPGLWETTVVMRREGAVPPMPDLSKLPPERRAHVEKMMGMYGGGDPITDKTCVTAAQLAKWDDMWKDGGDSDCQRKMLESSSRHAKAAMTCQGGQTTGTMEMKAESRERITGTMRMVRSAPQGEQVTKMEMTSRWLGDDCGGVAPAPE
jgi:hypothetical protein